MRAKRAAQQIGQQDQHFIAIEVTKTVVDLFEVVNIDDRQPLLVGVAARGLGVAAAWQNLWQTGVAGQLFIKRFAVEQASQGIALAVVQQALVVLVHLKNAQNYFQTVQRKRSRLGDFQARASPVVFPDRHPQNVTAPAWRMHGADLLVIDALLQRRVLRQGLARVGVQALHFR